ncbi:thiamine pyrophosphate-binding protein [Micromonospora sp. 4G57]|uniref:Thiamine pyrophosphate-binding protein n=1 Tax=Micromonospora sicca TaxID=2202420 RepID=A0ABU5JE49_9ACTN|nr:MULTISPECIES: thiamine pyrophosphate-binding protein [unclassified Micromonospora]MDZ5445017.1 thiamine pyrophosphate-binding protein [Micromonospora sp. 4G57]MDZ5490863.1 thiamine pyrophosphate-binding protein [Micromonospora sp. 4G53]
MTNFAPYDEPVWGSDVMVDVLRRLGLRYVALNPGSSFRGLHDSLVNYGGDEITMIECPHEKIAVGVAHGYAKATGEPMAVILHDLVGLLHGTMGVYYAYIDRTPVFVLGGSGPADHSRRRPNIDWIHSANVQGEAVRAYTKWDHEPRSLASVPTVLARAHRIAREEPRGPVYVALDAGLQEDRIADPVPLDDLPRLAAVPSPLAPDPDALRSLAERLCAARRPVMVLGYPGRHPGSFDVLVDLAEEVGIGAVETHWRLNFPNRHELNVTGSEAIEGADCVLFVDVKDMGKTTQRLESTTRRITSRLAAGCTVLDLGFNDVGISSWSEDYAELVPTDLQVTADTAVALPLLLAECRRILAAESPERRAERVGWRERLSAMHRSSWDRWQRRADEVADRSPVSTSRLAADVWTVVRDHDWVLTAGTAAEWALRTWDFDRPYRHPGRQLGTATQIGISLGVALAHKGTGRLVVDLQPDGDLMFDVGALWVASRYELPLLVVMFNNRAYYNDWEHQERLARQRGTPMERASIGMAIDTPAPDFAAVARGFGWWADGPVTDPARVRDAVRKAADHVLGTGRPALVDVVCQPN